MTGPYALVLRFQGEPVLPTPVQVHAAFLALVKRGDPALATALHNPRLGLRPFTLALVGNPATGRLGLRLSVLDPEVFRRFWDRWNARGGLPLVLGRRRLRPTAADETGPWAGRSDWAALATGKVDTSVKLAWCTPTVFRQGDVDLPLPVPKLVFGGLLDRWNRFSPLPLSLKAPRLERLVGLSSHRLRSRTFHDGRSAIPGFVGVSEYRILRSATPDEQRAVQVLAEFARFAGVGRKTTHGMGLVRVLP